MENQPGTRPISREQQLQLENEVLKQQLSRLMGARAQAVMATLGDVMDSLSFSLQRADGGDEEAAQVSKKDLEVLQTILKKVLESDWSLRTPRTRIIVPR